MVTNFWDNPFFSTLPYPLPMFCNNDSYAFVPDQIALSGGCILITQCLIFHYVDSGNEFIEFTNIFGPTSDAKQHLSQIYSV